MEDTRPQEAKEKDFLQKEIVATIAPTPWAQKDPSTWRRFPIRNQAQSGSCVAQTLAKVVGVDYWQKHGEDMANFPILSANTIYNRRSNAPAAGMIGVEAWNLAKEHGLALEAISPSQEKSDAQMATTPEPEWVEDTAKIFRIDNFIQPPIRDIDAIASTIAKTGKAVMVWFSFDLNEWTDEPTLKTQTPKERHSVSAVDFTLWNGERALIIDDSWGNFGQWRGQRIITETFFRQRNLFAAYPMGLKPIDGAGTKPSHGWHTDMAFGMTNPDIAAMQDALKWEGLFPANIESTGYYGAITATHVLAFQKKHGIPDGGLGGKIAGPKTRAKLNELYQ